MNIIPGLTLGLKGAADLVVGEQHTAPKVGSGRVHVLATPVMINLIEAAALAAVEHLLPPGQQSLGTHLDVRHFAATPVGMRVSAEAELTRVQLVTTTFSQVRTGSPYAVAPGRVVNKNRDAYRMFTPYSGTWREHGWPAPPMPPRRVSWMRPLKSDDLDDAPTPGNLRLPAAGEWAAHRRWREFIEQRLDTYGTTRDRADLDSTSRMSGSSE